MAGENSVKDGAAGCGSGLADSRGLKALVVASSLVLWVLALFTIVSLNSLRAEMKALRTTTDTIMAFGERQSLEAMQAVDKDGEVVYTFKRIPPPDTHCCAASNTGTCSALAGRAAPSACSSGTVGAGPTENADAAPTACGSAAARGCPAEAQSPAPAKGR
jgi:hypothetical protein